MTAEEKREIYSQLDNLKTQNQRILMILESDEKIREKGLVESVSEIKNTLNELLVREKVYKAKATTWGIIGGGLGTAALWVFKLLIGKIFV